MGKDRLIVTEARDGGYQIVWWLALEQDEGAALGDGCYSGKPRKIKCEMDAATMAVWDMASGHSRALYWESRADAQKALIVARRAVAEFNGAKPWPEWAKQAQAAGWKAPKGWTP